MICLRYRRSPQKVVFCNRKSKWFTAVWRIWTLKERNRKGRKKQKNWTYYYFWSLQLTPLVESAVPQMLPACSLTESQPTPILLAAFSETHQTILRKSLYQQQDFGYISTSMKVRTHKYYTMKNTRVQIQTCSRVRRALSPRAASNKAPKRTNSPLLAASTSTNCDSLSASKACICYTSLDFARIKQGPGKSSKTNNEQIAFIIC